MIWGGKNPFFWVNTQISYRVNRVSSKVMILLKSIQTAPEGQGQTHATIDDT